MKNITEGAIPCFHSCFLTDFVQMLYRMAIIMIFRHLKDLREDNDLRQKDIAEILNVSQNTYSQYETGVIALTAEVLIKLADYYGVTVDYLLDRTDKK